MNEGLPAAWFMAECTADAWLARLTERCRAHQPRIRPMAVYASATPPVIEALS